MGRRRLIIAGMPVIRLPDPGLVVLIGAAGSGKSTFAARHFKRSEILSSDALREQLTGDPGDQRADRLVFDILHRELDRRLASGGVTVVDATNVDARSRRALTDRAAAAGVPAVAIALDLPEETVLARNAARTHRVVDEAVVRRQLGRLGSSLDAARLASDGFIASWILRTTDDIATVRIERLDVVSPDRVRRS
jgi:predicted kinase